MRWVLLVVALVSVFSAEARAEMLELPLVVHRPTGSMVSDADVERLVAQANRDLLPVELRVVLVEVRAIPEVFVELETIAERRILRRYLVPFHINAFAVRRIHDPVASEATVRAAAAQGREPTGFISGAHIPAPGRRPSSYFIVTTTGRDNSLAHEIGHLLGLPHHADPDNLMSYGWERRSFDSRQIEIMQQAAARLLRRRILRRSSAFSDSVDGNGPLDGEQ